MMKLLNSNSIVGFVVGSAVCLTACLSIGSSDSEKVKDQRPVVSSVTMSPDIPSSVSFCGKDIDLTRYNMHEGFDRELSSFTYFHSTTMLLIKRANRYFPIIEPILKANGIPDDFKYLAVIESHLDPRVSSPARAVGTWQLLEGTARQYGLTITPTVDERCDVAKATAPLHFIRVYPLNIFPYKMPRTWPPPPAFRCKPDFLRHSHLRGRDLPDSRHI